MHTHLSYSWLHPNVFIPVSFTRVETWGQASSFGTHAISLFLINKKETVLEAISINQRSKILARFVNQQSIDKMASMTEVIEVVDRLFEAADKENLDAGDIRRDVESHFGLDSSSALSEAQRLDDWQS